jgi:glutamate/tyrosine decarboxylase-like PLP-dependent enzyme
MKPDEKPLEKPLEKNDLLRLTPAARAALWPRVFDAIEKYFAEVPSLPVAPEIDAAALRAMVGGFDFAKPVDPPAALEFAIDGLTNYQTQTPHPRYFGLFNPSAATMGVVADALVAAFNTQAGAWHHSAFAVEVEQHLLRALAARFGFDPARTEGTFTSGGTEANQTALLVAITRAFPDFAAAGARGLATAPVFYVSAESHHSLHRAARVSGLGNTAVREIPVDERLRMKVSALESRIAADRRADLAPFLIVATAGTTSAGAIDPLPAIAGIAAREKLWLHVDAAWGGAAALVPELRPLLAGIERADSITFDPHKWLSVPMGAGMYLNRHPGLLEKAFSVDAAYVPRSAGSLVADAYTASMQWSRRFIGLKLFLSLAVAGWEGYAAALRHMVEMANLLRRELDAAGWQVMFPTPLPVVCFVDGKNPRGQSADFIEGIARRVVSSGAAWISTTRVGPGTPLLRACITNFHTGPEDIRALVAALGSAREATLATPRPTAA